MPAPLLLFLEGQMDLHPPVYFHFHATDLLKQYEYMNMTTLVTKNKNILIFNFAHIIYPQRYIMTLKVMSVNDDNFLILLSGVISSENRKTSTIRNILGKYEAAKHFIIEFNVSHLFIK